MTTPADEPGPGAPHGQPYPSAPPYPPGQGRPPGYPGTYPRNELGVWSLVLGLAGIVLGCVFFTGIPAVVVGLQGRRAVEQGTANNPGVVTAGIALGWVSIGLGVLALLMLVPLVLLGLAVPFVAVHNG